MRRFVRAVLVINIAIVGVIGFTGFILHVGPAGGVAANEPILARELFAVYVGYAGMCLAVFAWFEDDRRWLLLPPFFLVPLWLGGLYEVIAQDSAASIPPSLIRPVLVAAYLVGFVKLEPRRGDRSGRAAPGAEAAQAVQ